MVLPFTTNPNGKRPILNWARIVEAIIIVVITSAITTMLTVYLTIKELSIKNDFLSQQQADLKTRIERIENRLIGGPDYFKKLSPDKK